MNVGIVICARMASTRLPGKVLLPTPDDRTLLEVLVDRVQKTGMRPVIVATTQNPEDDAIADLVFEGNSRPPIAFIHRGSTDDVLLRIVEAMDGLDLDAVVRLTADCPLVDPAVITYCVETFGKYDYDYVGTSDRFPDGMDVDVLSLEVLRKSLASPLKSDHEHVTLWAERNAKCLFVEPEEVGGDDWGDVRLTVDEGCDHDVIYALLDRVGPNGLMWEYVREYNSNRSYRVTNGHLARNAGLAKSLAAEKV